jgi:hypothetical protein
MAKDRQEIIAVLDLNLVGVGQMHRDDWPSYRETIADQLMALPEVDEPLRELLSYCREREEYKGRANEIGADTAYGDVAGKLTAILDGER